MTDRDRLIELIYCACRNYDEYEDSFHENGMSPMESFDEFAADCLIKNGVTVNEWISVEERLPQEEDADETGGILATHKASNVKYYHWRSVADNPFDFTHWMPLPEPPKGVNK